ncbi:MAG: DUF411 domain-containing protein [Acidobacteria bacterium]|nr:DUF411 domain-containing protein [Acidobacteriota bacterium]
MAPMRRFTAASAALGILLVSGQVALVGQGARAAAQTAPGAPAKAPTAMTVVRDPGCGCCLDWVAYLKREGFSVTVVDSATRQRDSKVPPQARSCHTGSIGGYLVEGHVPAGDIRKLLAERPAIVGIAAPGMPMGSPGMEQGGRVDPYDVVAFDKTGRLTVFSPHR